MQPLQESVSRNKKSRKDSLYYQEFGNAVILLDSRGDTIDVIHFYSWYQNRVEKGNEIGLFHYIDRRL